MRWTRAVMQIQSGEGAVWRCAETVTRRAKRDTMRSEVDYCEKVPRKAWLKKPQEGICWGARQRSAARLATRESSELESVVSCRDQDHGWRAKLNFGRGKPFDDLHWSTAFRAAPKTGRVFGGGSMLLGLRFWCRTEQLKAKRQESGTLAVG